MDASTRAVQAENTQLRQEVAELDDKLDYFRTAACYMAGYFHPHALETGIPLTQEIDLVEWAVLMANSRAK